jgi:HAD superfamily hydrolase (TIGR01549 family)
MSIEYVLAQAKCGRAILSDLDDTIYSERAFLHQQYRQLAQRLHPERQSELFRFLVDDFETNGRAGLFQRLKRRFTLPYSQSDILAQFRDYSNSDDTLEPFEWIKRLSTALDVDQPLVVITNGYPPQQREKARRLHLDRFLSNIILICANEGIAKPSPDALRRLKSTKEIKDPLFIGDSAIDRTFACHCAMEYVPVQSLHQ